MAGGERIAIFTKNWVNPNYVGFRLAAEKAGAALGANIVHRVPNLPDSAAEQMALLEAEIEQRPAAILFNPADDRLLAPLVCKTNVLAIPMVGFINRMAGDFITFVGADERLAALTSARYLLRHLGGTGSVVILEGTPTAPTSRERLEGYLQAIGEHPGVRLVGSLTGRYLEDGGHDVMCQLLSEHGRIDGVIATNDSMALGAIRAMRSAGRLVPIIGNNAIIQAAEAIRDGTLLATVAYDAFKMGSLATTAAIRHVRGLSVPALLMLPVEIIDRSNCAPWLVAFEQRPHRPWEELLTGM